VTTRFDPSVLAPDPEDRGRILAWLEAGLAAVEPEALTARALAPLAGTPAVVIAIGKAAAAMSRGAATILDVIGGVCVSDHVEPVPDTLRFMLGDHPVPGAASLEAGAAVLEAVRAVPLSTRIVALVSGGGSALCEAPREGVPPEYLSDATKRLIAGGAAIEEMNLVRAHLSAIKCGGLSREAGRAIETLVISDVAGADPGVVASGPTIPGVHDPDMAAGILTRMSIALPDSVRAAMSVEPAALPDPEVVLLADGRDAARAVAAAAPVPAAVREGWLGGDAGACLDRFLRDSGPGVTVGAGEVVLDVRGEGSGGRNTHTALLAAARLIGSADVFCAFATDGVDGGSGSAGAIVDGSTVRRGGDPTRSRDRFDSAAYLAGTSDLLLCPPTGTNVADVWILWRRQGARS
jgi:hydroxypyruvate reductase